MNNNRQNNRRRGRNPSRPQGGGGRGADPQNRIDNRTRGNAVQLHEKYRNMARDAQTKGDRVEAEYWWQFADHYFRVVADQRARAEERHGGGRSQRDEWRQQAEDDEDRPGAASRPSGRDEEEDGSDWRSEARGRDGRQGDGRQGDWQQDDRPGSGSARDDRSRQGNGHDPDADTPGGEDDRTARTTRRRRAQPSQSADHGAEAPRPRSRVPRKADAAGSDAGEDGVGEARLDGDVLPPSLTEDKPRRRGRPPKAKAEGTEAA